MKPALKVIDGGKGRFPWDEDQLLGKEEDVDDFSFFPFEKVWFSNKKLGGISLDELDFYERFERSIRQRPAWMEGADKADEQVGKQQVYDYRQIITKHVATRSENVVSVNAKFLKNRLAASSVALSIGVAAIVLSVVSYMNNWYPPTEFFLAIAFPAIGVTGANLIRIFEVSNENG